MLHSVSDFMLLYSPQFGTINTCCGASDSIV